MVGARLAPARAAVGSVEESGVTAQLGGRTEFAEAIDAVSTIGAAQLWLGGNGDGVAGSAQALIEGGLGSRGSSPFVRLGLAGELERNPYDGWYALEAPTLSGGYQYHGDGTQSFADSMHFDVGPIATLGLAGRAFAAESHADFVFAPALGGRVILMGELVSARASYRHFFESSPIDVVQTFACLDALVGLCLDGRLVRASFVSEPGTAPQDGVAWALGVSLGLGYATGTK